MDNDLKQGWPDGARPWWPTRHGCHAQPKGKDRCDCARCTAFRKIQNQKTTQRKAKNK